VEGNEYNHAFTKNGRSDAYHLWRIFREEKGEVHVDG